MIRASVLAFVLLLVLLLGMVLAHRVDDPVRVATTSEPTPSTTWAETFPTLPDGFDPVALTPTTTMRKAKLKARTASDLAGFVNGYPCGADLPPCRVLACESGGNPTARNPSSSASGLWQVLDGTWGGFGGYARAWQAPVSVQNDHARRLWNNGAGASHWRSCL